MRPHDPGQRVRDAGGSGAARVPPQVFRVQQVRSAAGARGPLLPAGRQSGVRAGLAQATQRLGGVGAGGAQGQGGPAAAKSGLRHRSVSSLTIPKGHSYIAFPEGIETPCINLLEARVRHNRTNFGIGLKIS